MTTTSTSLGFIAWEAEDSFADAADDTYTARLQIRDAMVDLSGLNRELIARGGVFQNYNSMDPYIPGAFNAAGTFSFEMDLYGTGTTAAGSLTATPLHNLLSQVLGNGDATQVGSTITAGAGDADTIYSSGATLVAGGLLRVGALGDGKGGGQAAVAADATSPYELLTALPGTPAEGDQIYPMLLNYPVSSYTSAQLTSDGSTSNNTLRFVLATGSLQVVARGCACTGLEISGLSPGEVPKIKFTFATAQWEFVDQTFPSATATGDYAPAPVAAGSVFVQASGTTTRATVQTREFSVSIGMGMQAIMGPGGASQAQNVVGWVRVPAETTVSFSVPSQDATASPTWATLFETDPNTITARHLLWLSAPIDGRAVAIYLPKLLPMGNIPTQSDIDGLAYVPVQFMAATNDSGADELLKANFVLGMG